MNNLLRSAGRLLPFAFATAFFTACSDSAVGPPSPSQSLAAVSEASSASVVLERPLKVGVLSFRDGVNTNTSATKVIGPEGGSITLAETGVTLLVPPGAVNQPKTFTITPVPGRLVAYQFEPHGSFKARLVVRQDLSKTNYVRGILLWGGHFSDPTKVHNEGKTADVDELLFLSIGADGWLTFNVDHFSGYLVSCA